MTHFLKKEIFKKEELYSEEVPNYIELYIRKKRNSPISNNLTPEKKFVNNISRFLIDNNYNCYTLKNYNFSELEEKILIETSIEMVNNPEKYNNRNYNYQMALCVYNYFKKKPFILKENQLLSGVGKVYRLDGMDKIIYLFSDTHHYIVEGCPENRDTIEFQKYIIELSDSIPLFLDIFVEINNFVRKDLEDYDDMSDIRIMNKKSYIDKFKENIRYHYIDNRYIVKNNILKDFICFSKTLFYQQHEEKEEEYKKRLIKLIDKLEEEHNFTIKILENENVFKEYVSNLIDLNKNIEKQFKKLDILLLSTYIDSNNIYEYIKKLIIQFAWNMNFKINLWEQKQNYNKIREILNSNLDFSRAITLFNNMIDIVFEHRAKITLPIMDMYFIGRLFKIFDTSKNIYDPIRAKYCIVYAGDLHIQIYKQLLEKIGFRTLEFNYSINPTYIKCLDLFKSVSQPLFNEIQIFNDQNNP